MNLKFVMIRHGETDANKNHIMQGHAEWPLNELGLKQAKAIGIRLEKFQFDRVYTSDLGRAKQTCSAIERASQYDLEVSEDILLRERHYGILENRPRSEYLELAKEQGVPKSEAVIVDGETAGQVRARCRNFLQKLESRLQDIISNKHFEQQAQVTSESEDFSNVSNCSSLHHNVSVLVVSHGGWIRQCLYHFRSLSTHASVQNVREVGKFANCGITELHIPLVCHRKKWSFDVSSVNFVKVNDHCHILGL